jgi:hypothetical protein
MRQTAWQRFVLNFGTLLLAFVLAVVVWVSAVVTADPNLEQNFGPVPVELVGLDADMLLVVSCIAGNGHLKIPINLNGSNNNPLWSSVGRSGWFRPGSTLFK